MKRGPSFKSLKGTHSRSDKFSKDIAEDSITHPDCKESEDQSIEKPKYKLNIKEWDS